MSELIKETKITHYVDAFHLADYLSEKIGRDVEVIESPNDTDYSVNITKEEIAEYDKETIESFLVDGYISMEYGYHVILTHCANEGWIEGGDYIIRVSW